MPYQTAFISYKRSASEGEAAYLHQRLQALGVNVFYDRDSLEAGDLFEKQLNEELVNRDCLIVILAPETLAESWWVRHEVKVALTQRKEVIPILTKGFTFSAESVPAQIAGLKEYNGIRFDYDIADFTVNKIAKVLEIDTAVNVTQAPPAPEKQPNWLARFLSSQSWQGISAIIGIIGVIIAVIALNASSQHSTPLTTPSLTAIATSQPPITTPSGNNYPCQGTIKSSGGTNVSLDQVKLNPFRSSTSQQAVNQGSTVTILEKQISDGVTWYKIRYSTESIIGWIPIEYVSQSNSC